jgi:intracellular septation protein
MNRVHFAASILSEFLPIATFVVVSECYDFEKGVWALMCMTIFALILSWYTEKRIPKFGLFAAAIILFFGALSIMFDNAFFIIIKDTLYYGIFGLALLVGLVIGRSPFQVFFEDFFAITERGWRTLSLRWAIFFLLLATSNEVVRHLYDPLVWVQYKLGILFVTWVFGFYQFTLMRRERLPIANPWGLRIKDVGNT